MEITAAVMDYSALESEKSRLLGQLREAEKKLKEMAKERDKFQSKTADHLKTIVTQAADLKAMRKELDELHDENKKLKAKVKSLKKKINNLEKMIADLKEECDAEKKECDMEKALFYAHDLTTMFIYYKVLPQLNRRSWKDAVNELADMVDDCKTGKITNNDLDKYINNTFPHLGISVIELQRLNQERHAFSHTYADTPSSYYYNETNILLCRDLRQTVSQQQFLQFLKGFTWPDGFKFLNEVKTIINILSGTNLCRMK
jgi:vacuolar-type H+-ATPase subunit I/STV1